MRQKSLPLTFRYNLIANLLASTQAGESAVVVGVARVGKSNLVHALQQPDIQAGHLGPNLDYLFVWIDGNDLTVMSPWHVFELLLHRLTLHGHMAGLPAEINVYLDNLHEKVLLAEDNLLQAQHAFEEAIYWLCHIHERKVVLLFDEVDTPLQMLPHRLFVHLRSLRDKNKYALVFLLFLRQALTEIPLAAEMQPFVELFQTRTYYLTPYDLAGTEMMLTRLAARQQVDWPLSETATVFELSGGHSGLIQVIFSRLLPDLKNNYPLVYEALENDPEIDQECQRIWESLTRPEQLLLQELVTTPSLLTTSHQAVPLESLRRKGVVRREAQAFSLFSPLFSHFVRNLDPIARADEFVFDRASQTCRINEQSVTLPALPAKLLQFLYENRGKPCNRVEILQRLYPDEDHSLLRRISDDPRLYDVVKNLRQKIEPDPQRPQYIKTVRGVGFKLEI